MPGRTERRRGQLVEAAGAERRREKHETGKAAERAVLVSVAILAKTREIPAAAQQARRAARGPRAAEEVDLGLDEIEVGVAGVQPGASEGASGEPGGAAGARVGTPAQSADEFRELAVSAGAEVVAQLEQRRQHADAATLVGPGKLEEIEGVVLSTDADLVLFDRDLTPSQLRNLENRLPCRVIDRTQLILDIFARHARTREGQMQVELAQLEYQLPRLAGRGKTMSQTGGGIGTRGPGETQIETDRRRIRARIVHVKEQLEGVRQIRRQQRQRREGVPVPVVALVGYTNAGKSTLFNALTEAGVLESERMFATLDTKLRQIRLPSRRKVLLSDTVGFIADLPHGLVTSFRATLEEVERAELLLHVQDAASPTRAEQRAEVLKVLGELEVAETPVLDVLNKIDLLPVAERVPAPGAGIAVSGLKRMGLEELLLAVDQHLTADPLLEVEMRVPQREGRVLAAVEAGATVEAKRFEGNLVYLRVAGPASLLNRYRRYHVRAEAEARGEGGGAGGARAEA